MQRLKTAAAGVVLAGGVLIPSHLPPSHVPVSRHSTHKTVQHTSAHNHQTRGTSMLLEMLKRPFDVIVQAQRAALRRQIAATRQRIGQAAKQATEQRQLAADQHLMVTQQQLLAAQQHELAVLQQELAATRSQVVSQQRTPFVAFAQATVPAAWLPVLVSAATNNGRCTMSWTTLAAIAAVETGFGSSTLPGVSSGTNAKGAAGPMQFEPATFASYALPVPPGGATPPSPYNVTDAVYAAARLLCTNGVMQHPAAAIYSYNHSLSYVAQVEAAAAGFANATAAKALGGAS